MNLVCPLCNGLYKVVFNCSQCNTIMVDKGPLVNLMDDYSPYLLDEITYLVDGVKRGECLHTYRCPNCGFKQNYSIERKVF
ncbi:conserved hypothetical protein [[Clostridium] ultunense Esp]|uniref:Uncharacterized protein n=1 Tax=[Clostridium] ultunense Esp TaxID=1288971 RepID=M1ZFY3_9FIRM|nr:hypothetical protein [Schnuerera ultunensis]CCQ97113.1 conserved hypothetical protein [[Clostridium] ultunense Esp]SHD78487.1 conserved protein of unknown function [[Clostridium] ultunense Esp]